MPATSASASARTGPADSSPRRTGAASTSSSGAARKPLTCRLFPFRFHPVEGKAVLSASFCCPDRRGERGRAGDGPGARRSAASTTSGRGRIPSPSGRSSSWPAVPSPRLRWRRLRDVLRTMLDHAAPRAASMPGQRAAMARLPRRHHPASRGEAGAGSVRRIRRADRPLRRRFRPALAATAALPPWAALLSRGFLFAVLAAREQLRSPASGMRLGLRARLARLLAHAWARSAVSATSICAPDVSWRAGLDDPAVRDLVLHYLRAAIEDLGTGRRPVVDELVMSVALLNAALAFAAMRAGQAGRARHRRRQPRRGSAGDDGPRACGAGRRVCASGRESGGGAGRALDAREQRKSIDTISK